MTLKVTFDRMIEIYTLHISEEVTMTCKTTTYMMHTFNIIICNKINVNNCCPRFRLPRRF